MNRPTEEPAHVSLFPMPPWQLINKYTDSEVTAGTSPLPPQPPISTTYRMFGSLFNTDDPILKPLEADGLRRVYPQTYNRKLELKKLNFSILANYLDLLDIITRDPSSPKRNEKLEHLGILFINMHHILNEYRPHQARDLLREMLLYQVEVARETVRHGMKYFNEADENLRVAGQKLCAPPVVYGDPTPTTSFADLGTELNTFLTDLQLDLKLSANTIKSTIIDGHNDRISAYGQQHRGDNAAVSPSHISSLELDSCIWAFLNE